MKKSLLFAAVATAGVIAAPSAQASLAADANLNMGAQTGVCAYDMGTYPDSCIVAATPTGNYFAMDNDGSGIWEDAERVGIDAGVDGGILLGQDQILGGIDSEWGFFGAPGYHFQNSSLSISSDNGMGDVTLSMSGWTVNWNGGDINMGEGADAIVTCGADCGVGDTFTLDYNAVVPSGGFEGVAYLLHLSGTIGTGTVAASDVPVPAAVWLFGSGLLGLVGVARRKTHA